MILAGKTINASVLGLSAVVVSVVVASAVTGAPRGA
jgi:hypothetical protein